MMEHRELLKKIEEKRKTMIALGEQYGLVSKLTLQASQELDLLIIYYQKMTMKQCISLTG